jgi:methylenetetrahydrofolate dehydrogenase (NADP+)/methenyltetrahydrofolate cyclohydrolase
MIMETRSIASNLLQHLQQDVTAFSRQYNQTPGLVLLGFGEDQSTIDFVRILGRNAPRAGMRITTMLLASNVKLAELRRQIEFLNNDPTVHAIALQLPLPEHLDVEEVASLIKLEKDVEGLHPTHAGRLLMGKPAMVAPPATSTLKLLDLYNINPAGRHVVIVGRSFEIGRPLHSLLTGANATVTLCHSATQNLQAHIRQAEILITAAGQPGLITAEMIRPGALIIDYGINYLNKARLVGDVDFDNVVKVAGAITPMPGGIGPLTVICLLENVLKAAHQQVTGENQMANQLPARPELTFSFLDNAKV